MGSIILVGFICFMTGSSVGLVLAGILSASAMDDRLREMEERYKERYKDERQRNCLYSLFK